MKKQLSIVLAIVMCLSIFMVGCGNENGNGNGNDNGNEHIGEEFERFDFDLSTYVQLGRYRGIEIPAADMPQTVVTDDDVMAEIQGLLEMSAMMDELFEGVVMWEDIALIDYMGFVDGVPFAGGAAHGHELTIGSGQFIPGFEEQLVGVQIGDTVMIDITFPEDYFSLELAGADAQFEVTIHSVLRLYMPELNEQFVREFTDYETIEELKESLREELQESIVFNARIELENMLWEAIMNDTEILGHPERELNALFTELRTHTEREANDWGMSWEEFLSEIGMTDEEVDEILLANAKQELEAEMILIAIARAEGIEFSDEEFDAGVLRFLNQLDFVDEADFYDRAGMSFVDAYGRETILFALTYEKIMEIVKETMVEVE